MRAQALRRYKTQLTRSSGVARSLYTRALVVEMFEEDAHAEYRAELRSMTRYDHFQTWKAEDVDHLQTKASNVIEEMNTRAPRLISLFRAITRPEDSRSKRDKGANDSRWIAIMAILLYTYMPRTCTRWPTMWGLQLHANGTKRRVIESLYHTGITVGYSAVLTAFADLTKVQKARIKELGVSGRFVIVYDNFEQTVKVKDQRLDNKGEFFSVTTVQILEPTWMLDGSLMQCMFNRQCKLKWYDITSHETFDPASDLSRKVGARTNNRCMYRH